MADVVVESEERAVDGAGAGRDQHRAQRVEVRARTTYRNTCDRDRQRRPAYGLQPSPVLEPLVATRHTCTLDSVVTPPFAARSSTACDRTSTCLSRIDSQSQSRRPRAGCQRRNPGVKLQWERPRLLSSNSTYESPECDQRSHATARRTKHLRRTLRSSSQGQLL